MKSTIIVPFVAAAAAAAFVIPDERITHELAVQAGEFQDLVSSWWDKVPSVREVEAAIETTATPALDVLKDAVGSLPGLDGLVGLDVGSELRDFLPAREHDGDHDGDHDRGGHGGHRHHHDKTIYQAIKTSEYTTRLAELVDEHPDIVKVLNSTAKNLTLFAPTNKAFEKIPHHDDEKPSKEFLVRLLTYHVVPDVYPARRILASNTLPTVLMEEELGGHSQRLRISVGFLGVRVNFFSKVVAVDIGTKNGIIHAVDHILVPPPPARRIVQLLPSQFSTLTLAFKESGLAEDHKTLKTTGLTFFAPTNWAFRKLGPKANAFLFNTEQGHRCLNGLLRYHLVVNETLYSDAYYGKDKDKDKGKSKGKGKGKGSDEDKDASATGKQFHIDLPTLLHDRHLGVDIGTWGPFTAFKINGFTRVATPDVVAKDGVVHVLQSVLIPPHPHKRSYEDGEEMDVDELRERLEPYLETTPRPGVASSGDL